MLGPIDYVVIGFEGNNFDGGVLDELSKAIDKGIIRVIDLLFIVKDDNGVVNESEFEDQSKEIQEMLKGIRYTPKEGMPLLTNADIAKIGEQMPNGSAAGALMIEHVWAKGLKQSLIDHGGFLIADGRIHPEAIETAIKELAVTEV